MVASPRRDSSCHSGVLSSSLPRKSLVFFSAFRLENPLHAITRKPHESTTLLYMAPFPFHPTQVFQTQVFEAIITYLHRSGYEEIRAALHGCIPPEVFYHEDWAPQGVQPDIMASRAGVTSLFVLEEHPHGAEYRLAEWRVLALFACRQQGNCHLLVPETDFCYYESLLAGQDSFPPISLIKY